MSADETRETPPDQTEGRCGAYPGHRVHCVTIDVDGEPATGHWAQPPTEADLDAFRDLIRAVRALPADPGSVARRKAAAERIRARAERIAQEQS